MSINNDNDGSSNIDTRRGRNGETVWQSDLETINDPEIRVHPKVRAILATIQSQNSGKEFSALFKYEWRSWGLYVKPDYVIPEQKVTRSTVDYVEDMKQYRDEGYGVHVHSHPFTSRKTSFSGTDHGSVNQNFDCALLINKDIEFVDSVLNVEVQPGRQLQIQPDVAVQRTDYNIDVDGLEKIDKKSRSSSKRSSRKKKRKSKMNHGYGGRGGRPTGRGGSGSAWPSATRGSGANARQDDVEVETLEGDDDGDDEVEQSLHDIREQMFGHWG